MKSKNRYFLLFLISTYLLSTSSIVAQKTIEELDNVASFSFSIMSDNKGYSVENPHMYKCDKWIKDAGDRFIIGVGDHVKDNKKNLFLNLLKNDTLWHNHFYPNVADGENEYWGTGQGDWGAGHPILNSVDLANKKNVKLRDNKCEYYAVEEHSGIKVHIVQLHYSDTPKNPLVAFHENTRKYLMNTLDSINKTDNDIIVVLAHTGDWFNQLSLERKKKLMNKADIILGATSHFFKRYHYLDDDNTCDAIAFNSGAVGNSIDNGFMQVHVLKNPTRMIVQYQRTNATTRLLQEKGFAFEKIINGKSKEIDWDIFKINNHSGQDSSPK